MATVKVKFRLPSGRSREGTLFYQVIHRRVARQISTGYRLLPNEWNGSAICFGASPERDVGLRRTAERMAADLERLSRTIAALEAKRTPYTSDDVVTAFHLSAQQADTVFTLMRQLIAMKRACGSIRTAETYETTLNSFTRFRKGEDLPFSALDEDTLACYETWLKCEGVCKNTSSFYMRRLQTSYNRAVEKGLAPPGNPFRRVYTGVDKTVKRAIDLPTLRRIRNMDLSLSPSLDLARDMFLFCFYTRGMSFIDMAYLKKTDIKNGVLSYRRRKTGQQLHIRWEECMQGIIDKYDTKQSPYLLPIITEPGRDERRQYANKGHSINNNLKKVGARVGLEAPLTMYVGRHAWANIAKSRNIPVSVISECMGHNSEATTRIYLASLDTGVLDKANRTVINSLK